MHTSPRSAAEGPFGTTTYGSTMFAGGSKLTARPTFEHSATVSDGAPPPPVDIGGAEQFQDANIEGTTATADAAGVPGSVTAEARMDVETSAAIGESHVTVGPFRSETGAIVITAQLRAEAIEHLEAAMTVLESSDFEPTGMERLVIEEIAKPDIERALSALRGDTAVVSQLLAELKTVNRRLKRVRAAFGLAKHGAQVANAVNAVITILDKLP